MKQLLPGQNSGVIISPVRDKDLHVGALTASIVNTSADWQAYECDGEWQEDMTIDWDTEACMSFTGSNNIATYLNWLIATNNILAPQLAFLRANGYIGADGKVALSPRFTAKMSNTTINGNDFQNVWDSLQNDGVVPDSAWPMPTAELNAAPSGNWWNIYYAEPTAEVIALGKEFLTFFKIEWEWLVSDGAGASQAQYKEWLQVAPIHLAIAVCNPWNVATPIEGCGSGAQHGVQLSNVNVGGVNDILDHYVPFDKKLASDYSLSYAVHGIVTQIPQATAPATPVTPAIPTVVNPTTDEVPVVSELNYDQNELKTANPAQKADIVQEVKNLIGFLESFVNGHNPQS